MAIARVRRAWAPRRLVALALAAMLLVALLPAQVTEPSTFTEAPHRPTAHARRRHAPSGAPLPATPIPSEAATHPVLADTSTRWVEPLAELPAFDSASAADHSGEDAVGRLWYPHRGRWAAFPPVGSERVGSLPGLGTLFVGPESACKSTSFMGVNGQRAPVIRPPWSRSSRREAAEALSMQGSAANISRCARHERWFWQLANVATYRGFAYVDDAVVDATRRSCIEFGRQRGLTDMGRSGTVDAALAACEAVVVDDESDTIALQFGSAAGPVVGVHPDPVYSRLFLLPLGTAPTALRDVRLNRHAIAEVNKTDADSARRPAKMAMRERLREGPRSDDGPLRVLDRMLWAPPADLRLRPEFVDRWIMPLISAGLDAVASDISAPVWVPRPVGNRLTFAGDSCHHGARRCLDGGAARGAPVPPRPALHGVVLRLAGGRDSVVGLDDEDWNGRRAVVARSFVLGSPVHGCGGFPLKLVSPPTAHHLHCARVAWEMRRLLARELAADGDHRRATTSFGKCLVGIAQGFGAPARVLDGVEELRVRLQRATRAHGCIVEMLPPSEIVDRAPDVDVLVVVDAVSTELLLSLLRRPCGSGVVFLRSARDVRLSSTSLPLPWLHTTSVDLPCAPTLRDLRCHATLGPMAEADTRTAIQTIVQTLKRVMSNASIVHL